MKKLETRKLIEATCPECRGPLSEVNDDGIVVYECLVGHRYTPDAVLRTHYETQERMLWAAVVSLEEATKLVLAVASHLSAEAARNLQDAADDKLDQAKRVRGILNDLKPYRLTK